MDEIKINEEMVTCVAERFRVLSDRTRIRILLRLKAGPANVGSLARDVGLSQSSISKHLAQLRQVGILQVQREGTHALYSIRDPQIFDLCALMCEGVRRHHGAMHEALGLSSDQSDEILSRKEDSHA